MLKAHLFWPIFLATFYDLKVTFGYIGESPENFMSKYIQEVSILRVNIVFFGPNMAASMEV